MLRACQRLLEPQQQVREVLMDPDLQDAAAATMPQQQLQVRQLARQYHSVIGAAHCDWCGTVWLPCSMQEAD